MGIWASLRLRGVGLYALSPRSLWELWGWTMWSAALAQTHIAQLQLVHMGGGHFLHMDGDVPAVASRVLDFLRESTEHAVPA